MFLTNLRRPAVLRLAFVLVVLVGCGKGTTEQTAKSELGDAKPDFSLTAEQLSQEFQKDKTGTVQKYAEKVVELSGVVEMMKSGLENGPRVYFHDAQVGAVFDPAGPEPWALAVPGQAIKIRARGLKEPNYDCILEKAIIVDRGQSPAITITAEQVAKEVATDKEATIKKYKGKYLIVEGEIAEIEQRDNPSVNLKGDAKFNLDCVVPSENAKLAMPLKVGQHVKIVGLCDTSFKETPYMRGCLPISPTK